MSKRKTEERYEREDGKEFFSKHTSNTKYLSSESERDDEWVREYWVTEIIVLDCTFSKKVGKRTEKECFQGSRVKTKQRETTKGGMEE